MSHDAYLEPCQTSMIERFAKIVAGLRRSLFFNKVAGLRPATLSQKRLRHKRGMGKRDVKVGIITIYVRKLYKEARPIY